MCRIIKLAFQHTILSILKNKAVVKFYANNHLEPTQDIIYDILKSEYKLHLAFRWYLGIHF